MLVGYLIPRMLEILGDEVAEKKDIFSSTATPEETLRTNLTEDKETRDCVGSTVLGTDLSRFLLANCLVP